MREQAKKMNVASLRSSEAANTSAECKLAKVKLIQSRIDLLNHQYVMYYACIFCGRWLL